MTVDINILRCGSPSRYIEIYDHGQEILIIDTDQLRGGLYFWMISSSNSSGTYDVDGYGRLKMIGVDTV